MGIICLKNNQPINKTTNIQTELLWKFYLDNLGMFYLNWKNIIVILWLTLALDLFCHLLSLICHFKILFYFVIWSYFCHFHFNGKPLEFYHSFSSWWNCFNEVLCNEFCYISFRLFSHLWHSVLTLLQLSKKTCIPIYCAFKAFMHTQTEVYIYMLEHVYIYFPIYSHSMSLVYIVWVDI